jgi:hypothetical protein
MALLGLLLRRAPEGLLRNQNLKSDRRPCRLGGINEKPWRELKLKLPLPLLLLLLEMLAQRSPGQLHRRQALENLKTRVQTEVVHSFRRSGEAVLQSGR